MAGFAAPPSHETAEFAFAHGEAVEQTCAVCHARDFCAQCHVNAPDVPEIAGLPADTRSLSLVASVPVPASHETADFLSAHGAAAAATSQSCASCHTADSCTTCHIGTPQVAAAMPSAGPGRGTGAVVLRDRPPSHVIDFFTGPRIDGGGTPRDLRRLSRTLRLHGMPSARGRSRWELPSDRLPVPSSGGRLRPRDLVLRLSCDRRVLHLVPRVGGSRRRRRRGNPRVVVPRRADRFLGRARGGGPVQSRDVRLVPRRARLPRMSFFDRWARNRSARSGLRRGDAPEGEPPDVHGVSRERGPDESLTSVPARRRILRPLAAGLVGLGVLWVGYEALTWPDVAALRDANPDRTAFIDRYVERSGSAPAWTWVPASRISPHLEEAVIVGEDLEFFSHEGFSTHEIEQAIRRAIEEREAPRGASTITQQLAKNLWLSPSRNPLRKGREVILTKQLETKLTKYRILELYLNVVEFGPGVYGAEAAARHYFGKPAATLSQREAAMLAAALPRPSQWHPGVTSSYYARRVETLLERMRQVTFLDRRLGIEAPKPEDVPLEVREPPAVGVTPIEPLPEPEDTATSP